MNFDERDGRAQVIASTKTKRPPFLWSQASLADWWACYAEKLEGANEGPEEGEGMCHACCSFLACFLYIGLLGLIQEYLLPGLSEVYEVPLTITSASWGAAAVHVFCTWHFPGAQPKSVVLGNVIGAGAGLLASKVPLLPLKAALAVALTVAGQELTGTVHPAGAANALLLVDEEYISWHAFGLNISGSVLIVVVACLFNNLFNDRFYPQAWWPALQPPDEAPGQRLVPPSAGFLVHAPQEWLKVYLLKLEGGHALGPTQVSNAHTCFSSLISFLFMLCIAVINEALDFDPAALMAAAAAAVSIFSDWRGPSSQPWPCLVGSLLAAACGALTAEVLHWMPITAAGLAVGLTAAAQELAGAVFPAGGAIALVFVVSPQRSPIWSSVLYTGLLSASLLVIFGTLLNNLQETRRFPRRWPWQRGGTAPHSFLPPLARPRQSERNLVRRWMELERGSSQYSHVYVGVLTVALQCFFLIFLFFAEVDMSMETITSMCNSLAWASMLVLAGFGYMQSFLKAYGLGAVGYSMLITSLAVQWSMILESLLDLKPLHFGFSSLVQGYSAAAAVLISFGALIGKVDLLQILALVVLELPCYCWNKVVFLQLTAGNKPVVHDAGGLEVFLFGAFFGLAAARVLGPAEMSWLNRSQRSSELLALLGTACFWACLPCFVAAHAKRVDTKPHAWLNTVLALLGSTVAAFGVDPLLEDGRLEPAATRGAALAGGVAISVVAGEVEPFIALAVGCLSGGMATCGLRFASRELDTCGVLFVHGLPAVLGGPGASPRGLGLGERAHRWCVWTAPMAAGAETGARKQQANGSSAEKWRNERSEKLSALLETPGRANITAVQIRNLWNACNFT